MPCCSILAVLKDENVSTKNVRSNNKSYILNNVVRKITEKHHKYNLYSTANTQMQSLYRSLSALKMLVTLQLRY
jgi:hypothetical protein